MSRFAANTNVPIGRSRGAIDILLRRWGVTGINWADDFDSEVVSLRFRWPRDGHEYLARFAIRLQPASELKEAATNRYGKLAQAKYERMMGDRGKREHRVLLLWITAALNAVDAGIVTAEELFLPFLEGKDGRTMAEVAVPRLAELFTGSAKRLLPAPSP